MSVFQYSTVRKEQEILKTPYTIYSYVENKSMLSKHD